MERKTIDIDDITYEIRMDTSNMVEGNKRYYIRAGQPFQYLTDNMTYREAQKVVKSMRQLGLTVIDRVLEKPTVTNPALLLTELERDWLGAFAEGDCMYVCHIEAYTKKIKSQQISGVVSSLSKKKLLVVEKYDGLEINTLTDAGIEIVKQLRSK